MGQSKAVHGTSLLNVTHVWYQVLRRESTPSVSARSSTDCHSLLSFIFYSVCVYQTLDAKFLHPAAANEPFLIE